MNNTTIQKVLDEIRDRLVVEFQPSAIYVFGSQVWGLPDIDSDIDILVIVPETDEDSVKRATRGYSALSGIRKPVDIIVRSQKEMDFGKRVYASLECKILEKGERIYG